MTPICGVRSNGVAFVHQWERHVGKVNRERYCITDRVSSDLCSEFAQLLRPLGGKLRDYNDGTDGTSASAGRNESF